MGETLEKPGRRCQSPNPREGRSSAPAPRKPPHESARKRRLQRLPCGFPRRSAHFPIGTARAHANPAHAAQHSGSPLSEEGHDETQTGDDRQWHGRRSHARGTAQGRPRALRHHGVRCRAAPELQPHPAFARSCWRTGLRRYRAERPRLVSQARHPPAARSKGCANRSKQTPCDRRGRQRSGL